MVNTVDRHLSEWLANSMCKKEFTNRGHVLFKFRLHLDASRFPVPMILAFIFERIWFSGGVSTRAGAQSAFEAIERNGVLVVVLLHKQVHMRVGQTPVFCLLAGPRERSKGKWRGMEKSPQANGSCGPTTSPGGRERERQRQGKQEFGIGRAVREGRNRFGVPPVTWLAGPADSRTPSWEEAATVSHLGVHPLSRPTRCLLPSPEIARAKLVSRSAEIAIACTLGAVVPRRAFSAAVGAAGLGARPRHLGQGQVPRRQDGLRSRRRGGLRPTVLGRYLEDRLRHLCWVRLSPQPPPLRRAQATRMVALRPVQGHPQQPRPKQGTCRGCWRAQRRHTKGTVPWRTWSS